MLNFDNVENLVCYMFENLKDGEPVSVVADQDLSISILRELLEYKNVVLKYINVNSWEYDKEYFVTLRGGLESDFWYISIEPAYNYENKVYLGEDGYVLFHEDVNSKAMIDMQNNKNIKMSGHDWFVIGESFVENDFDTKNSNIDEAELSDVTSVNTYKINGKEVTKEAYKSELAKIEEMCLDHMRDVLLGYTEFMDEMNEWRKLFRW